MLPGIVRNLCTFLQGNVCIEGMAYGTVIKMCDKLSLNPVDFTSLERDASLGAGHNFIVPYATSAYSGMMFDGYC